MDAVDDDLDDHVRTGQRRAGEAGIAVRERAHRVEEVRDGVDAALEGGVRLVTGRVGVPERDGDAALLEQVDQLEGAGQLGRERDQPHRAGGQQSLEERGIGVAPELGGMRAEALGREERPFEVDAEDPRAFRGERHRAEGGTTCWPPRP